MYRDIMLATTDTPADEAALGAAVAFARAYDARLLVAMALHLPITATAYGMSPIVVVLMAERKLCLSPTVCSSAIQESSRCQS